tara:strand:- start:419 stop:1387 length:969 start_codon:yes stop_codon:yes gene_type:complete
MSEKVCVIGGGYWGKNHIRTLADLGCLGAVVDSDVDLLNEYSKKYPKIKIFNNVDDSLSSNEFDGYTVATPAHTHYEIAKKIICAEKHVLVEKPLTLNLTDAEELNLLAKKNRVTLMVGHVMLFHPAIIKIKELIDSNTLGNIHYIYSNRLNFGQVRTNEDVLWSLGPHDISILLYLSNSSIVDLEAKGSDFLQKGIADSVLISSTFKNGLESHIFESWLHPFKEHRLTVVGSNGMLSFEDSSANKSIILYDKKYDLNNKIPIKIESETRIIDYPKKQALTEELSYFVKNMKLDIKKKSDGMHAVEVMKVLLHATDKINNKG